MAVPRLDLSAAAKSDISNIWRYTAEKWSVEQADAYYESIANAATSNRYMKLIGSISTCTRRLPVTFSAELSQKRT